jgi:hypothetical protein
LQGIATNGFFVFAGIPSFEDFIYNDGFANFSRAIRWCFSRAAATLPAKSATGPWTLMARIPTRLILG